MNPSFAVEKTLGKLAKWLRLLGFDTVYEQGLTPETFAGERHNRILLTRTRRTWEANAPEDCLLITADRVFDQLKQVIRTLSLHIDDIRPFSRCISCNTPIAPIDKTAVYGRVPDYIWETHERFQHCDQCRQTFWEGSHVDRGMEKIRQLFAKSDPPCTRTGLG